MTNCNQPGRCLGPSRREIVRLGCLSALGLSFGGWSRLRAATASSTPVRARSCILIWLDGGPSHLETFDPKPDASVEVRGPMATIETRLPGVRISELLPETARRLDRVAVVRSVTSPLGEHNLGSHYLLTGYLPTPALEYPSFGAVVAHVRGGQGVLPPYVAVPEAVAMAGAGYLPGTARPFAVGGDPAKADFRVRDLNYYPGVTSLRAERRRSFLRALDGIEGAAIGDPEFEQAHRLVSAPAARTAFALEQEPSEVRDRYGRKTLGQALLLARRLVERGVPFVTVNDRGWDTHDNLYTRLKEGYTGAKVGVGLVPTLDRAYAALLDDLGERGMLDETLVVIMGEFGRTPKLNTLEGATTGRGSSALRWRVEAFAGGQVLGASDATGESPADRPVTPADLAATIYTLLGVEPGLELRTADGRPVPVNQGGTAIPELLG